jgi:putative nucleotidyltransferase with HDIG domain
MAVAVDNSASFAGVRDAVERLADHARAMGVHLSVWSIDGARATDKHLDPACRCLECPLDGAVAAELVLATVREGQTQIAADTGCCLMALPLRHRRRLAGIVTACYWPLEILADPPMNDFAHDADATPEEVARQLRPLCRHSREHCAEIARSLEFVLKRECDLSVAGAELANLTANLASTYEELSLVYRISGSMKVTQKPHEFLQTVCDDLVEVMNIDAAAGIIHAHSGQQDDHVVLAGSIEINADQVKLLAATQVEPRASGASRAFVDNHFSPDSFSGLSTRIHSLIAVPLMADDRPIGMLIGLNKRNRQDPSHPGEFDSVDIKLVSSIGNQAAVFLENHRLYADLHELLMGLLRALTGTIDAKDPYTRGHSQRVALLAKRLAEAVGFDAARVYRVHLAGLLHDIGKIGVPERVLCKEGKLTQEEYETIKRHPAIGARILKGIRQLDDVVVGILTHHERPDGRGYPQGLAGEQVPIEGKIVGLADVFDAMTSDRTYRKAMPLADVMAEIRRCAGTQFDPALVDKLVAMDLEGLVASLRAASAEPGVVEEQEASA